MITVIKKMIIIKKKEGKRSGKKKTRVRQYSNLALLSQHHGFTTRLRGLSHLNPAKSFNLNKTDVIITVNTSKVVYNMQNIFKET